MPCKFIASRQPLPLQYKHSRSLQGITADTDFLGNQILVYKIFEGMMIIKDKLLM